MLTATSRREESGKKSGEDETSPLRLRSATASSVISGDAEWDSVSLLRRDTEDEEEEGDDEDEAEIQLEEEMGEGAQAADAKGSGGSKGAVQTEDAEAVEKNRRRKRRKSAKIMLCKLDLASLEADILLCWPSIFRPELDRSSVMAALTNAPDGAFVVRPSGQFPLAKALCVSFGGITLHFLIERWVTSAKQVHKSRRRRRTDDLEGLEWSHLMTKIRGL